MTSQEQREQNHRAVSLTSGHAFSESCQVKDRVKKTVLLVDFAAWSCFLDFPSLALLPLQFSRVFLLCRVSFHILCCPRYFPQPFACAFLDFSHLSWSSLSTLKLSRFFSLFTCCERVDHAYNCSFEFCIYFM